MVAMWMGWHMVSSANVVVRHPASCRVPSARRLRLTVAHSARSASGGAPEDISSGAGPGMSPAATQLMQQELGQHPGPMGLVQQQQQQPTPAGVTMHDGSRSSSGSNSMGVGYAGTFISELRIKDFALISDQVIALRPGLAVVTGQSGAGKSVLVEAINQVLGGTARDGMVRPPARCAVVEATMHLSPASVAEANSLLRALGLPSKALLPPGSAGNIVIRRELAAANADAVGEGQGTPLTGVRSRCSVNGCATSLRVLRLLGQLLVDVNAQHAAQRLRDPQVQLQLLDRLSPPVLGLKAASSAFGASLSSLRIKRSRLAALQGLNDGGARGRLERLVKEVSDAGVEVQEDVSLRSALKRLELRRSSVERCGMMSAQMGGDGAGAGGLQAVLRELQWQLQELTDREDGIANQRRQAGAGSNTTQAGAAGAANSTGLATAPKQGEGEEKEEEEEGGLGARGQLDGADEKGELGGDVDGGGEADGDLEAAAELSSAAELLAEAQGLLDSAARHVGRYSRHHRWSLGQAEEIRSRLKEVDRLVRRYDCINATDLVAKAAAAEKVLSAYYESRGEMESLHSSVVGLEADLAQQAVQLGMMRRAAAGRLRGAVEGLLAQLAMPSTRFEARVSWQLEGSAQQQQQRSGVAGGEGGSGGGGGSSSTSVTWLEVGAEAAGQVDEAGGRYRAAPSGLDMVQLLVAAGPHEPLRPMGAVASGGEVARLMLALKAAPGLVMAAGPNKTHDAPAGPSSPSSSAAAAADAVVSAIDAIGSVSGASSGNDGLAAGSGGVNSGSGGDVSGVDGTASSGGDGVLILDELDSGVGARLGASVGQLLRRMAGCADTAADFSAAVNGIDGSSIGGGGGGGSVASQILCVTHLPQVAAAAEQHLVVRKEPGPDGRLVTVVRCLETSAERMKELRDMAGLDTNMLQGEE